MAVVIKTLRVHIDPESRGFEIQGMQKSGCLDSKDVRDIVMQTVRPHKLRGNHYHDKKTEWFLPLTGFAVLSWFNVDAPNQKGTELMNADFQNPKIFEIQPRTCHTVENKSEEDFYMLAFSSADFDPCDPDNPKC